MHRRKQRKIKARRPGQRSGHKWGAQTRTASTLSGPRVSPDELDVKLEYRDFQTLQNAGGGLAAKEYKMNDAFDVDPALGSTETYGFDEYAALYSYYRVIAISYKIDVANVQTNPVNVYLTLTNTDPTATGTNYLLYSSNPYCKSKLLSSSNGGGATHRFSGHLPFSKLLGSMAVETSDSFRALTTGHPIDLLYLTIAAESALGGSLASGLTYDLRLQLHVRFYGREVDLSLAGVMARLERLRSAREENEKQKREKYLLKKH